MDIVKRQNKLYQLLIYIFKITPGIMCWAFVLILPVGYYPDSTNSTNYIIGMHGGTGQVASVLRGCDGNTLHGETSSFTDVSAETYFPIHFSRKSITYLGLRVGHFRSIYGSAVRTYEYPNHIYSRGPDRIIDFWYYNPNISYESNKFGIGIGAVLGDEELRVDDNHDNYNDNSKIEPSYHIRLGRINKGYFKLSFRENTPILSSGGLWDIGIGYPVDKSVLLYSGLAGGFYDGVGFVQKGSIRINKSTYWDVAIRLGGSGGESECAISTGLAFTLGRSYTNSNDK